MSIKHIIKQKDIDRQGIEHIQLAHNTRYPEKGYAGSDVVYTFGQRGQLDVPAIKRFVTSLSHLISREETQDLESHGTGIKCISITRTVEGPFLVKGWWKSGLPMKSIWILNRRSIKL